MGISLNRKEAKKVAEMYDLGKLKEFKPIAKGLVNYNYIFNTTKGDFIVRIVSEVADKEKQEKLKLEFRVLNYLNKRGFPYEIPLPLLNSKGEYLLKLGKKRLWVYKKIDGKNIGKVDKDKIKSLARAMAIYHKTIRSFQIRKKKEDHCPKFLLKMYRRLEKLKPKNKTDRLLLKNVPFFKSVLEEVSKVKADNKVNDKTIIHSDLNKDNVLFGKKDVQAIIDFDSLKVSSRIQDVSNVIKSHCLSKRKLDKRKIKLFFREYEKICPLTKKEKDMIIPTIIKENCYLFWWFHSKMEKNPKMRMALLNKTVDVTKNLFKNMQSKELSMF